MHCALIRPVPRVADESADTRRDVVEGHDDHEGRKELQLNGLVHLVLELGDVVGHLMKHIVHFILELGHVFHELVEDAFRYALRHA